MLLSPPILVIEGNSEHTWYVPVEDVDWHDNILRLRVPTQQLSTHTPYTSEGDQHNRSHKPCTGCAG